MDGSIGFMQRCLALAERGQGRVQSNPMVGAVIVYQGRIVAEGYHRAYGEAHAEVMAFANLPSDVPSQDCDLYVNLEPCSHQGKTPPCADLVIRKKVMRTFIAMEDPNPLVKGRGIAKLKASGMTVHLGLCRKEAEDLNASFVHFHTTGLPYITLKWAQTKDGFLGRKKGDAADRQISQEVNKAMVHQLRSSHMAILVGAETARQDDPQLNNRHWSGGQPTIIVLSKTGSGLEDLKMRQAKKVLHCTSVDEVLALGKEHGIQSILVEGGSLTLQSFIDSSCWNQALVLKSRLDWEAGVVAPLLSKEDFVGRSNIGGDEVDHYKNNGYRQNSQLN